MPTPSACLVLGETQLTLAAVRSGAELKTLQNIPSYYKKQHTLSSPQLLPQPPLLSGAAGDAETAPRAALPSAARGTSPPDTGT